MTRIGMMIRSAKMNEITPPKLIPPFHKTAARARAWPSASRTRIDGSRIGGRAAGAGRGDGQQLPQAVLEQLVREAVAQPVEDHPAVLAEADQPGKPQHLQRVG